MDAVPEGSLLKQSVLEYRLFEARDSKPLRVSSRFFVSSRSGATCRESFGSRLICAARFAESLRRTDARPGRGLCRSLVLEVVVLRRGSRHRDQGRGYVMRDRNTFAKRQRETKKKQKAEEKRALRRKRKEAANGSEDPGGDSRPANEP